MKEATDIDQSCYLSAPRAYTRHEYTYHPSKKHSIQCGIGREAVHGFFCSTDLSGSSHADFWDLQ